MEDCICEIKCRIAMTRAAFDKKRALFASTLDLELRKKLVKCYIWSVALYGAETGTVRAVDQKQLESFEMWCWRRMGKIIWTDRVGNEKVLLRVKEQRNILHEISKRKANWIGHILRRNCLLQRVIEGKIKVTGRRRKLLDYLKERRGYPHLKEEALDCSIWRRLWTCRKTDYRGADKSLARSEKTQANISVRMAFVSFGALPCKKKSLMIARVSMLLKSRASLTCFRACFLN